MLISKNIFAIIADWLKSSGKIGITASTKILQSMGKTFFIVFHLSPSFLASFGTSIVCICLLLFIDCTRPNLLLFLLALFGIFFSGMVSGAYTAALNIAPEFSGIIESLGGFMGMLAYVLCPTISGFINKTVNKKGKHHSKNLDIL